MACRTADTDSRPSRIHALPARDLLGQLAVELSGIDDKALVRAFGDPVDAIVSHDWGNRETDGTFPWNLETGETFPDYLSPETDQRRGDA